MLIPFAQEPRLDRKESTMKPIPTEMRKRILNDCDNGMSGWWIEPHGHWVNNTYVCGLRHHRIVAPHVFVGAMNAARFLHYLETILLPTLRKGDMVVIDNLPGHVDGRVKPLIESKGMNVLYLPAYSPDLNPIELSFSKLKSVLRKEKIRDVPALQKFLLESGRLFTKKECQNYFKHYGCTVHKH